MMKLLLVSLSVILLVPNFIDKDINDTLTYNGQERFNASLKYINSAAKLEAYTDSIAVQEKISPASEAYFTLLEYIVSQKFYHGFSHFTLKENWLAAVSEKLTQYGLGSKVKPDDILKNEHAGCSQQSIVMMDIAKRKNVPYRHVGFPHHYALEIKCNNNWYFFDPNLEPEISETQRTQQYWKAKNDSLKKFYPKIESSNLDFKFGQQLVANFGDVNETPAARLKLFQTATFLLSKTLWLLPLLILVLCTMKKRRPFFVTNLKTVAKSQGDLYSIIPA